MYLIKNNVSMGNQQVSPMAASGAKGIWVSASNWDTATVTINWSIDNGITWSPLSANSGSTSEPLSGIAANGNWSIAALNGVLLKAVVATIGSATGLNVEVI